MVLVLIEICLTTGKQTMYHPNCMHNKIAPKTGQTEWQKCMQFKNDVTANISCIDENKYGRKTTVDRSPLWTGLPYRWCVMTKV